MNQLQPISKAMLRESNHKIYMQCNSHYKKSTNNAKQIWYCLKMHIKPFFYKGNEVDQHQSDLGQRGT